METCCIIVEKRNAKYVKNLLESVDLLHNEFKITKMDNTVAIPITFKYVSDNFCVDNIPKISCLFMIKYISNSKLFPAKAKTHFQKLISLIQDHLKDVEISEKEKEALLQDLPNKWEIHCDLIIFPNTSFTIEYWEHQPVEFWGKISEIFGVKRIALQSKVGPDGFRTPGVVIKLGDSGIVQHIDNGITYAYDITKNMFSKGNITEKLRISRFDCAGETVVDMFAGIGYFTLPYLVKAKAKMVYACDWSPDAVTFLQHNLRINKVDEKCVVLQGDNREITPKNVADRVNLGLIPSSSGSWQAACEALKKDTGGWLHIHENIEVVKTNDASKCECMVNGHDCVINEAYKRTSDKQRMKLCGFVYSCIGKLKSHLGEEKPWRIYLDHVEYVKSYAPHIDHMVFDFECRPKD